jgi:autotransporter-associated beta strand protein
MACLLGVRPRIAGVVSPTENIRTFGTFPMRLQPPAPVLALLLAAWLALGGGVAAPIALGQFDYGWSLVGDAGNTADSRTGFGAVSREFSIQTFEFTNQHYVEFLNAVDPTGADQFLYYFQSMTLRAEGGIVYEANRPVGERYFAKPFMGDKPVNYVSWYAAARVANWLTNGMGSAETHTGAYRLTAGQVLSVSRVNDVATYTTATPTGVQVGDLVAIGGFDTNNLRRSGIVLSTPDATTFTVAQQGDNANVTSAPDDFFYMQGSSQDRLAGAVYRLPTEDEWYKAAYYKGGGTNAGYWSYGTQSDTPPTAFGATTLGDGVPGGEGNWANFGRSAKYDLVTLGFDIWAQNIPNGSVVSVGTGGGPSGYGLYDMTQNVWEWTEGPVPSSNVNRPTDVVRIRRGGGWRNDDVRGYAERVDQDPNFQQLNTGFRLVSPAQTSLEWTGAAERWGGQAGAWIGGQTVSSAASGRFVFDEALLTGANTTVSMNRAGVTMMSLSLRAATDETGFTLSTDNNNGTGIRLAGPVEVTRGRHVAAGPNPIALQGTWDWNIAADAALDWGIGLVQLEAAPLPYGLRKTGAGTLTLRGENTYAGPTTVTAGTLLIEGNQTAATGAVRVAAGATLGGSGTVGGATTIAGTHAPGSSPGVQTFAGDLTYEAGADIIWELTANLDTQVEEAPVFDQVVVGGTLDFAGTTTLRLSFDALGSTVDWGDPFWAADRSWVLFTGAATTTGFENLILDGPLTLNGTDWFDENGASLEAVRPGSMFALALSGDDVSIVYTAVPEPSAIALVAAAAVAGLCRRRRPT